MELGTVCPRKLDLVSPHMTDQQVGSACIEVIEPRFSQPNTYRHVEDESLKPHSDDGQFAASRAVPSSTTHEMRRRDVEELDKVV